MARIDVRGEGHPEEVNSAPGGTTGPSRSAGTGPEPGAGRFEVGRPRAGFPGPFRRDPRESRPGGQMNQITDTVPTPRSDWRSCSPGGTRRSSTAPGRVPGGDRHARRGEGPDRPLRGPGRLRDPAPRPAPGAIGPLRGHRRRRVRRQRRHLPPRVRRPRPSSTASCGYSSTPTRRSSRWC